MKPLKTVLHRLPAVRRRPVAEAETALPARHYRGQAVTVRSLAEILATLDADGKLAGLPFMPEMVPFCGRTFRVHRRAERTCVEGGHGLRRLADTVFLEGLRCDGSAHEGCQRGCLLFWKEAWLQTAGEGDGGGMAPAAAEAAAALPTRKGDRFCCQSTELAGASEPLPRGDLRYYLQDLWSGEVRLTRFLYYFWLKSISFVWRRLFRREYCAPPTGSESKTASAELNLEGGELVEVKSAAEIQATLDAEGRNRGLSFEYEMLRYCGRCLRVLGPVRAIIDEATGKRVELSNTVILERAICEGICLRNCPRANYFYWREIWLKRAERVSSDSQRQVSSPSGRG
jgi:hypothetical protein